MFVHGEVDAVQSAVAATGAWGPVVYVVLHVLLTLVPVSKNLLSGVAGALFGLATFLSGLATMATVRLLGTGRTGQATG